MNWLRTIEEDRLVSMFQRLASELKEKDLAENPRELDEAELNQLGTDLTTKWQEENFKDLESKLVEFYGTDADKAEYAEWQSKGE